MEYKIKMVVAGFSLLEAKLTLCCYKKKCSRRAKLCCGYLKKVLTLLGEFI